MDIHDCACDHSQKPLTCYHQYMTSPTPLSRQDATLQEPQDAILNKEKERLHRLSQKKVSFSQENKENIPPKDDTKTNPERDVKEEEGYNAR